MKVHYSITHNSQNVDIETDKWTDKMYIHTMKQYSVVKWSEEPITAMTGIMLNERSHTQKTTIREIQNSQFHSDKVSLQLSGPERREWGVTTL
jgi:hypothetical protein